MEQYLSIVDEILTKGKRKSNRTGVDTLVIDGMIFKHDMSQGFPLLTTKKMAHKSVRVELEGFIEGITDKKWFQDRGCTIWDEWGNPQKVHYGHDEKTRKKMREERDLGPIYGFQWRHFGANYEGYEKSYEGEGIDQLKIAIETLRKDPGNRRQIVSAWNPKDLDKMALPPCHYAFHLTITGNKLNLFWNQRSVDTMLGLPFNIASYGVLNHLIAKELNIESGNLIGFLDDSQIYVNHINEAKEQLKRKPFQLSKIETKDFTSIYNWQHNHTKFIDYQHHPLIKFDIAI